MQLVAFDLELQTRFGPFPFRDGTAVWQSPGHASGSEVFTDITGAPDALAEPRMRPGDMVLPRLELLLLDLDTDC
ncbi:hypothetical protein [Gordonia neofelifaecis]|nr:hypothetical protein [Gordonia neofelifaecis]